MQPDYIRLVLQNECQYKTIKKVLPDYLAYLLFYSPEQIYVKMDAIGDFQGLKIILPITEEELDRLKPAWMEKYMTHIQNKLQIRETACFVDDCLLERFALEQPSYGKELKLMLLEEMLPMILRKHGIAGRAAKYVLIDDGSPQFAYVLYMMAKEANYLIVISNRQDEIQKWLDSVYEQYGLAVQVYTDKQVTVLEADMIVNLREDKEKITTRIQGSGCLFDFGYTAQKARTLGQMNPNLHIYHTMKMKSTAKEIPVETLAKILYYREPLFRGFVKGSIRQEDCVELIEIWDRYFVEMVKVL